MKKNNKKVNRINKTKKADKKISNLLLVFIFLCIFAFGLFKFISPQFKQVVETPKSFQSNAPVEVDQKLSLVDSYQVPILMYHYVEYVKDGNDTIRQSLNIDPGIFEEQIKTLSDAGFTFMTVGELAQVIDGRKELPIRPIVLTFDDGHWDLVTDVLPILERYNAKATVYMISGFIGDSDFLSDAQIRQLLDSGIFELGAHTVHHVSLRNKFNPIVMYEVEQSKKELEERYKTKVVSFAYPDGAFDEQAIESVIKSGYTSAVSTIPGIVQNPENKYYLFRLRPGRRVGEDLLNYFKQKEYVKW